MPSESNTLEALKLISDWAKWLVTIQTGAIAIIATIITSSKAGISQRGKVFGSIAIVCMLISIISAAMLLLTLPEIAQNLRTDTNIWLTRDSMAGYFFHVDTQTLAILESAFFGIGLLFVVVSIITVIWSRKIIDEAQER